MAALIPQTLSIATWPALPRIRCADSRRGLISLSSARGILVLGFHGHGGNKLGAGRCTVRVRVWSSLDGEGSDGASNEVDWLLENLPLQLANDGLDMETSTLIGGACADACARFLETGKAFDSMMIMDAMEEEVERRDLRGDFLPFEIGRKAAKLLTQKWDGSARRPKMLREPFDNKLDVVDFDKFPKNLNLP